VCIFIVYCFFFLKKTYVAFLFLRNGRASGSVSDRRAFAAKINTERVDDSVAKKRNEARTVFVPSAGDTSILTVPCWTSLPRLSQ